MNWLVARSLVAFYPAAHGLPGLDELEVDAFVAKLRGEAGWAYWIGVLGSCLAFQLSPLLTVYLPLPAFLLSARLRDRHAHRAAGHSLYLLRQAMTLVKTTAALHYGAHPKVRAAFGLDPYPPDPDGWRTT